MENQYSNEKISEIREYIKTHGHAQNYQEPTFYLLHRPKKMRQTFYKK
jgi:hypothetical protein